MDRRAIDCFDQALVDVGLGSDERLRQVLHDYFAWTTVTTMSRYHRSPRMSQTGYTSHSGRVMDSPTGDSATHKLPESTIRSAYTILRAVLDTVVRDRALAQNPAHAVRRPRVPVTEAAYLMPDQVRYLLLAAKPSRYAPAFELLVNTELRRGEALALHWPDIDFDEKLLRVRGTFARVAGELIVTETKTPRSRRVIPLSPAAERLLRDMRANQRVERLRASSMWQPTPYVFTTELGEPVILVMRYVP
ncbi:MAG TPA: tyrosine-type recombinase/integrase [Propionibacteriaceae bacterium]|nr:tyrosine-type recombinase/integrase [Propionibacteriaceae bacterium]